MKLFKLISPYTFSLIFLWGCHVTQVRNNERPPAWAQKVDTTRFHNLFKVDQNLYRSEQPKTLSMRELDKCGIKTILNLRSTRKDKNRARKTNLILEQVPINADRISYDDLVKSLKIIDKAKKPVLVHCWHGSDRTGCVVAAYRIVNEGWTKDQAIAELMEGGYGFHQKWFPNIIVLLRSIDVEKLKNDIER